MLLPSLPPPSPTNRFAQNEDAALLGFRIFFDARFAQTSPHTTDHEIRCATCHLPEKDFHDGLPTSLGIGTVTRNSPTLLNSAYLRRFFWDGRAETLWAQPLFAFEAPNEMDFTRLEIAHALNTLNYYGTPYKTLYANAFGAFPSVEHLPPRGSPSHPAWDNLPETDKTTVNRIAANVGKALEAYMRKIAAGRSALDRFILGDPTALPETAQRGLVLFVREAGCIGCHYGPMLTDESYHVTGVSGEPPYDPGRFHGLEVLQNDTTFSATGVFSDGEPLPYTEHSSPNLMYAFKTPSLRNVASPNNTYQHSAPYGHNGAFASLKDMVQWEASGAGLTLNKETPFDFDPLLYARLEAQPLTPAQIDDLVSFLQHLHGDPPPLPWANWPDR
jgi:cytochrome c peroxidase